MIDSIWLSFETEQEIPVAGAAGIVSELVHAGAAANAGAVAAPPMNASAANTDGTARTSFRAVMYTNVHCFAGARCEPEPPTQIPLVGGLKALLVSRCSAACSMRHREICRT
jgi:hypothetical protein